MGTPETSKIYLQTLLDNNYNIVGVYSQPSRKSGRGMEGRDSPVSSLAKRNSLPLFNPENFKSHIEIEKFKNLKADLGIVMGYGNILPSTILNECNLGFINIHLSLLPKWRGAAPIEYAIINGEKETGVTIFKLNNKLDAGLILGVKKCTISIHENKDDIMSKVNNIGKNLLIDILPRYISNELNLFPQIENNVSYAPKIKKIDTKINFSETAIKVYNKIRAFAPLPGAWFNFNGERIKILSCKIIDKKGKASTIISDDFIIACDDNSIKPLTIQREGKRVMKVEDFLLGFRFSKEDKIY
ncbi:MAG: Methionyl-tRNA formyltransferase [Alphaproteobacteria bacterium MarineAlpha5_Bin11]|nr:MAG: Methionyl-tRNA formyltransferase [Alphaproteobacteria bacterium MarineAlpha5_Bin11]PPR50226.1 MAG: Methionyl-tRNA formyltransferase [Alphaproteobacteria bacterium MarineAlpha5_Bin10]|tara:strand:- start:8140 stop:9039 length:900 start_codon:yes stop_codon:yes gene_type:complete